MIKLFCKHLFTRTMFWGILLAILIWGFGVALRDAILFPLFIFLFFEDIIDRVLDDMKRRK